MKIYIASDHGGYKLKEALKLFLAAEGHEVEDMGAYRLDPEDDYPDFVIPAAQKVAQNPGSLGMVIGRSGNGEQIAANKVKGVRAALCLNEVMAQKAREHNGANILSLGADYIDPEMAEKIVKIFLETSLSPDPKYKRRIDKDTAYENTR